MVAVMKHEKRRYTFQEAAVLLGVRTEGIGALVRHGHLHTVDGAERPRIPAEDITGFLAHRDDRKPTIEAATLRSHQAYARSAAVDRRLDRLETLLNLNLPGIDCSEEAMAALLLEASEDSRIARRHAPLPSKLLVWARRLYALGETHLGLFVRMGETDPWRPLIEVAESLLRHQQPGAADVEAVTAAAYLRASLGYFRNTVMVYTRLTNGSGAMRRPFIDEHMALLFPGDNSEAR